MNAPRRVWMTMCLVLVGVGVTLIGGAAKSAADTSGPQCGTGKPICATLDSVADPTSRSPAGNDHYMTYSLEVSYKAGATSTLTNLALKVEWADIGVPVTATSTTYVGSESDSRCTETAARTLTCTGLPKSMGPGSIPVPYGPLIFRTATTTADPNDVEATGTDVFLTASAKETPNPPKGGTNVAFVKVSNPTSYEDVGDQDLSIAGGGLSPVLTTSNAGTVNQVSKLPVAGTAPRGLFQVVETNYGGAVTCPAAVDNADLACFGQHVTTLTVTGTTPVNLKIVYEGARPGNEGDLGVFHQRATGDPVLITALCTSDAPLLSEITAKNGCLGQRKMTTIPGTSGNVRVELSAWDINNGGWGGIS